MLLPCDHEQVMALFVTSKVAFLFSASGEDDEEQLVFVEGFEVLSSKVFGEREILGILNLALKVMQSSFLAQIPEKVLKSERLPSVAAARRLWWPPEMPVPRAVLLCLRSPAAGRRHQQPEATPW